MTIKSTLLYLLTFIGIGIQAQTVQFLFCGKTEAIATLDGSGKDQRAKASIKLDFIKMGIIGSSVSNPFYVLGEVQAVNNNDNFANKVLTDGCSGSTGTTGLCNQCTTCTNASSTTGNNIGTSNGKFLANVKVESIGNDMYIMCTGVNNVVCYETNKINVSSYVNKKLEITYKVEGISTLNAADVKNMSLNYRFNDEAYFTTPYFFNKNSSNIGIFEGTNTLSKGVPVATEDLTKKLKFGIHPNPAKDILKVDLTIYQEFKGFVNIISEKGDVAYFESIQFQPSSTSKEISVEDLPQGNYILNISDEDGRASVARFIKL
jgi:hypothetical protein